MQYRVSVTPDVAHSGATTTTEPLGPGSLVWELGFPRASLLLAGRALLLQVTHPTVGAGVRDYSNFRQDPWGRLERTVRSLLIQLFGGADAVTEARRLRELHHTINGTGFHGEHYQALDPDAYAWVHLSNFETVLLFHNRFAEPLDEHRRCRFYLEWRQVGLLLGIGESHLPPDLDGLRSYVDDVVANTLEDNDTARDLLDALTLRQVPPPKHLLPAPLWEALKPVGRFLLRDATVGTLPPVLRAKLGLDWTASDERRLMATAGVIRALDVRLPARIVHYGPAYQALRAKPAVA